MKFFLAAIAAGIALIASLAHADEAAVRSTLRKALPQGSLTSISKTPVAGVVEAVVDGHIFYLTEDGHYVFGGPLIDTRSNENLTQARLDRINAIPFDKLPLERAIKRVKGDGSRKLAIFEDPDCPYCKKLEQEMRDVDNLTTYVFLYPIAQLHPNALGKSKAVWCAADRTKAWDEAMRTGAVPTGPANCDNPIDRNLAYGRTHYISGTPTMILANGQRLVGAVPREQLEQALERAAKK